jgi:hypothetical protein
MVVGPRSIVTAVLVARGALWGVLFVLVCAVLVVPFSAPSGLLSIRAALLALHGSCASLDRAVCGQFWKHLQGRMTVECIVMQPVALAARLSRAVCCQATDLVDCLQHGSLAALADCRRCGARSLHRTSG